MQNWSIDQSGASCSCVPPPVTRFMPQRYWSTSGKPRRLIGSKLPRTQAERPKLLQSAASELMSLILYFMFIHIHITINVLNVMYLGNDYFSTILFITGFFFYFIIIFLIIRSNHFYFSTLA